MPAFVRQQKGQKRFLLGPNNGYEGNGDNGFVRSNRLKPLKHNDIVTGLASLLLIVCSKDDSCTDLYTCDPLLNPLNLTRKDLERDDFVNTAFVERLRDNQEFVKTIRTQEGRVQRLYISHINLTSPH